MSLICARLALLKTTKVGGEGKGWIRDRRSMSKQIVVDVIRECVFRYQEGVLLADQEDMLGVDQKDVLPGINSPIDSDPLLFSSIFKKINRACCTLAVLSILVNK